MRLERLDGEDVQRLGPPRARLNCAPWCRGASCSAGGGDLKGVRDGEMTRCQLHARL